MVLLAIDTASSSCAAALMDGEGTLLADEAEDRRTGHAERLIPMIADILFEAGLRKSDLSKIAVSVGPGSFTGVRTGIAAARGLALALSVPAVGVTTLEAMAADGRRLLGDVPILSAIDAGRGEVYVASFDADGVVVLPACKWSYDRFEADRPELPIATMRFVGNGIAPLGLKAHALADSRTGGIGTIAALGLIREPVGAPQPLYLRSADAKLPSASALIARQDERSAY
ncbi:tRNA (adenosine(37)-N6)-threonylcarbamoyltransferase complex dimerization subunit type 1 TsaB [Notoacmeibacter sp. MSK16QG-6]|uniref:tRNA (adenosine(37)-N6)-threonylcarbamoyltransferase complex dimerization subunit type 1 TsaB n=1 Tax=Notoacmeibacter sp. MSK16QG-6 TaxID=2957982 RepID=UPI00209C7351|nr:tRNA (adenosine(37)-N6)-threonylcarbamoyltransferase complex dimerization subunit type 1 TsaB [Notoacmeibacter sp. MSK16QG-6]MCP1198810.1 tRNA (adenosine(37)-N6)-threonylcarbamoyltransferase complex dimerization subunit type 1 TsaB [Notoacmeibacter sp. MSK16QG-6]